MGPEAALLTMLGVGTGISAVSQYQQGKEAKSLAKKQAGALAQDAAALRESSKEEARLKREEGRKLRARQTVAYASAGVKPLWK